MKFLQNFFLLIGKILLGVFILLLIVLGTVGYFANYDSYHVETERKNLFEPVKIVSTKDINLSKTYKYSYKNR